MFTVAQRYDPVSLCSVGKHQYHRSTSAGLARLAGRVEKTNSKEPTNKLSFKKQDAAGRFRSLANHQQKGALFAKTHYTGKLS